MAAALRRDDDRGEEESLIEGSKIKPVLVEVCEALRFVFRVIVMRISVERLMHQSTKHQLGGFRVSGISR